ncbi:MAG: FAD-dependent oxidoreductase [Woeseiaceae bacterium]|nr:FAD-dependent oxidoreductase [Woeseiaceae bacterium]
MAIIGAGLSGLVVARALDERCDVTVFEKSRGVGGRMATRYSHPWQFDHGAQFFTARSAAFRAFLEPLICDGVVAPWPARFAEIDAARVVARRNWDDGYPHYVAVPGMNAMGKRLARGLDIRTGTPVSATERVAHEWRLSGNGDELGAFDWLVITAPAPQAAALLPPESGLSRVAHAAAMLPCFALMLGSTTLVDTGWDCALVKNSPVSWLSIDSSKPGRNGHTAVVVHSSNAWAAEHIDDDPCSVQERLTAAASALLGADPRDWHHAALHRWRYANIDTRQAAPQVDDRLRVAACGDWFVRGRVEGAFTSARRLLDELDRSI